MQTLNALRWARRHELNNDNMNSKVGLHAGGDNICPADLLAKRLDESGLVALLCSCRVMSHGLLHWANSFRSFFLASSHFQSCSEFFMRFTASKEMRVNENEYENSFNAFSAPF